MNENNGYSSGYQYAAQQAPQYETNPYQSTSYQQNYQQQPYQPQQQYVPVVQAAREMSLGDWILTIFLSGIPLVGLICKIVWACSSDPVYKPRKYWALATIIIAAASIVLVTIIGGSLVSLVYDLFEELMYDLVW